MCGCDPGFGATAMEDTTTTIQMFWLIFFQQKPTKGQNCGKFGGNSRAKKVKCRVMIKEETSLFQAQNQQVKL